MSQLSEMKRLTATFGLGTAFGSVLTLCAVAGVVTTSKHLRKAVVESTTAYFNEPEPEVVMGERVA